jgi:hypothetical protein
MASQRKAPPGFKWVYCTSYMHAKSKRRVYAAPGTVFAFLVPA